VSKSKVFWIAFPLVVVAVSVLGVSRYRQQEAPISAPALVQQTADANQPASEPDSSTPTVHPTSATPSAMNPAGMNPGVTTNQAPAPVQVTIPARTRIGVRLNHSIATDRVNSGDPFFATVTEPVVVKGQTVIPRGVPVKGRVVSVHEAGKLKGVAELRLALESVRINGTDYDLHSSTFARVGENHNKRNAIAIGGASGAGALIGALAGGRNGALIGGASGAGAGTAGAALTAHKNFEIPAETAMTFQLLDPVVVGI